MPRISVIVPIYNVEKYIRASITSLLDQTMIDFEALLVDDGSLDRSIAIAREVVGDDSRFKFLSKINGGLSDARNFGIDRASAPVIAFLDSDDCYTSDFLSSMLDKMDAENSDIVICDVALINESGRILRVQSAGYNSAISGEEAFANNLGVGSIISMAQNKIFKRELFFSIKFPVGLYYEDRATTYKIFLSAQKVSFVSRPLLLYLQRAGSIMNSLSTKKIDDRFLVLHSINDFLMQRGLDLDYRSEYVRCYLLNVCASGAMQVAMYSADFPRDIEYLRSRFDKKLFNMKELWALRRTHRAKMLALTLLLISPRAFRQLVRLQQRGRLT